MERPHASSPRQTLSYLRNLLEGRNIRPQSKRGQSFLIDLNLLDLIVRTADLTKDDVVLEVGSGTGSLTARLVPSAAAVLSVEIDTAFYGLVKEIVGERDNLVLLHTDVLKNKNTLNEAVLKTLADLRERSRASRLKLVANLPYAVATPVIGNRVLEELPLAKMVVTVQWEIAERLSAHPGTKAYGALAVFVQSLADVSIVRQLAPSVFWPRPKVGSAIVSITPNAQKRLSVNTRVGDPKRLRNFLRDLYVHRRKNLRGALVGLASGSHDKQEVDRKLAGLSLEGTTRAEALAVEQHLRLCEVFG